MINYWIFFLVLQMSNPDNVTRAYIPMLSDNLVVNCGLLRGILEKNRVTIGTNLKRIDDELAVRPLTTNVYSKT